MAQRDSEQYREIPNDQEVRSTPPAGQDQSLVDDPELKGVDTSEVGELRESPTSLVGYGGGSNEYVVESTDLAAGEWRKSGELSEEEEERDRRQYDVDEAVGNGSEVKRGVPYGLRAEGVDGLGKEGKPSEEEIEQHEYHRTEQTEEQKNSPYSQAFTQSGGVRDGDHTRVQEDKDIVGNARGGTASDHDQERKESGEDEDGHEGFVKRMLHKISPRRKAANSGLGVADGFPDDNDEEVVENEDEKPGVVTKLKDKLTPNHRDEIDPEIFN